MPDKHEQILRVFAPDVSRLDLYVLDDQTIEEVYRHQQPDPTDKPLPSSDYMLPLPQSSRTLDVYLRLVSDHQLRPYITLDLAVMLAANQGKPLMYGDARLPADAVTAQPPRLQFTRSISSLWLHGNL